MAGPSLFDFQRSTKRRYKPFVNTQRRQRIRWINRGILLLVVLAIAYFSFHKAESGALEQELPTPISESVENLENSDSMDTDTSEEGIVEESVVADSPIITDIPYQKNPALGGRMQQILRQEKPAAAVYLAVDAQSNEILAWGVRSDDSIHTSPAWLGRSTFPAASLIKMVTSVAAIESNRYDPQTQIPMIGRSTTLYYRQLSVPKNYNGPTLSLEDAFAHSANAAMGIIGQSLGAQRVKSAASRLGFTRPFPGNFPHISFFTPPDTGYSLAEATSGFTRKNTTSPLHVAAMVRALLARKDLEIPWSHELQTFGIPANSQPMQKSHFRSETYGAMRQLFLATVSHGTARKQMFRQVPALTRESLWIGGKTGSLDGMAPPGRYDWFAGFAQRKDNPQRAVIVVVMQVHQKYRTLPSAGVAGVIIREWFKGERK